eukprot:403330699
MTQVPNQKSLNISISHQTHREGAEQPLKDLAYNSQANKGHESDCWETDSEMSDDQISIQSSDYESIDESDMEMEDCYYSKLNIERLHQHQQTFNWYGNQTKSTSRTPSEQKYFDQPTLKWDGHIWNFPQQPQNSTNKTIQYMDERERSNNNLINTQNQSEQREKNRRKIDVNMILILMIFVSPNLKSLFVDDMKFSLFNQTVQNINDYKAQVFDLIFGKSLGRYYMKNVILQLETLKITLGNESSSFILKLLVQAKELKIDNIQVYCVKAKNQYQFFCFMMRWKGKDSLKKLCFKNYQSEGLAGKLLQLKYLKKIILPYCFESHDDIDQVSAKQIIDVFLQVDNELQLGRLKNICFVIRENSIEPDMSEDAIYLSTLETFESNPIYKDLKLKIEKVHLNYTYDMNYEQNHPKFHSYLGLCGSLD